MIGKDFANRLSIVDFRSVVAGAADRDARLQNEEIAENALTWYKRFLYLSYLYPGEGLGIPEIADQLWHSHILDTRKYFEDCKVLFGRYLHHAAGSPHGDQSAISKKTSDYFFLHFGERPEFAGELEYATCVAPSPHLAA